jgi:hypothetical protein
LPTWKKKLLGMLLALLFPVILAIVGVGYLLGIVFSILYGMMLGPCMVAAAAHKLHACITVLCCPASIALGAVYGILTGLIFGFILTC